MARVAIPASVQTSVLVSSRRRCCICYGLKRDTEIKSGQIAHLDHKNTNNAENNLAWLCLVHHDEYDSVTSQRKSFTISEVKHYRSELIKALGSSFSQKVHFGEVSLPSEDPYAGKYIRIGSGSDSAEILITPVPDTMSGDPQYAVTGMALFGFNRANGPNMGEMSFIAAMNTEGELLYLRDTTTLSLAVTRLIFENDGALRIQEEGYFTEYGANVSFIGLYQRAAH